MTNLIREAAARYETMGLVALHAEKARLAAIPANRRTNEVKMHAALVADAIEDATFDWSEADRTA